MARATGLVSRPRHSQIIIHKGFFVAGSRATFSAKLPQDCPGWLIDFGEAGRYPLIGYREIIGLASALLDQQIDDNQSSSSSRAFHVRISVSAFDPMKSCSFRFAVSTWATAKQT